MPKIAEQARAARREQIVTAGLACFARSGYHATTMADVAAQAGVSKGTPYLYFASKETLFLALHEEWDCGAGRRMDAAIAALPEAARRSLRTRWLAHAGMWDSARARSGRRMPVWLMWLARMGAAGRMYLRDGAGDLLARRVPPPGRQPNVDARTFRLLSRSDTSVRRSPACTL